MNRQSFADRLLDWYAHNGRQDLPWRRNIQPYRVWLSEIMLQQTQVATVIPYFERFVATFPDVEALAASSLDQVLHLWTGLGYYARARNLHRCAQIVSDKYGGGFPDSLDALQDLPGIGRSTAGAILAIAYHQRGVILDGNVKRVLARHGGIEGWPGKTAVSARLWALAEDHTPLERVGDYTQAIMDLGATVCTRRRPDCPRCPMAGDCTALAKGCIDSLPTPRAPRQLPVRETLFMLIEAQQQILLCQRPPAGLWGGLWCFPECDAEDGLPQACEQFGLSIESYHLGPKQRHTFSHYHLDYRPAYIQAAAPSAAVAENARRWVRSGEWPSIGLPAPIKALLNDWHGSDFARSNTVNKV